MSTRLRALKRVQTLASDCYADVSASVKKLELTLSSGEEPPDLNQKLLDSRSEEQARGTTVVGPHRDDLIIYLGGTTQHPNPLCRTRLKL